MGTFGECTAAVPCSVVSSWEALAGCRAQTSVTGAACLQKRYTCWLYLVNQEQGNAALYHMPETQRVETTPNAVGIHPLRPLVPPDRLGPLGGGGGPGRAERSRITAAGPRPVTEGTPGQVRLAPDEMAGLQRIAWNKSKTTVRTGTNSPSRMQDHRFTSRAREGGT